MVGVAWNGSDESMVEFQERHGLSFPSIRDETGELYARFGVPGQPAWVFIGAGGTLDRYIGALPEDRLDDVFAVLAAT